RIYPAIHYTMGGLWVDYNLMSNLPGLFVIGEANFSDHGANRLGASALMQGLADGYFILPYTIGNYLATQKPDQRPRTDQPEFRAAEQQVRAQLKKLLAIRGRKTVTEFHKQIGKILWDYCGMTRSRQGLERAIQLIGELRKEFWENVNVPGSDEDLNQSLERAGRVADYLELGELIARDALTREESCGCHFRVEYQTPDHECLRNDRDFAHVACWEFTGDGNTPVRHIEPLIFEAVQPTERSYK
ncbi:MAG: FAD-binding protein, partial [Verrucomicrobiae bacterium]|nr:FAD-binding protein [Verrucomicrobiae bacterium]